MSGIKAVRPAGAAVLVGLDRSEMTLPVEHIQNLEITAGVFRYTGILRRLVSTWPPAAQADLDSLVTGSIRTSSGADEALESDLDPKSLKSVVYPNGYQTAQL